MKKSIVFMIATLCSLGIYSQSFRTLIIKNDTCYVLPDTMKYFNFKIDEKDIQKSYPNGDWVQMKYNKVIERFELKNNLLNGLWIEFDTNNRIKEKGQFIDGRETGPFYRYFNS
jgi:antitoxin component YwqK of YwqJK toxin-antitoxin module